MPFWIFKKTEDSNFYYDLMGDNKRLLANFIAVATNQEPRSVYALFEELEADETVNSCIKKFQMQTPDLKDSHLFFGRRLGWYALTRILKPKNVIETGVHNGLGGLAIQAALKRNAIEGYAGRYFGTDINPKAGSIFRGTEFSSFGEVIFGDSISSINALDVTFDLVITDSDHTAGYEARELRALGAKSSSSTFFASDNHETLVLQEFAWSTNMRYMLFKERPLNHWYRGAGLGLAWSKPS